MDANFFIIFILEILANVRELYSVPEHVAVFT